MIKLPDTEYWILEYPGRILAPRVSGKMTFRILEYPESGLIFAFFVIFKLRIPDTGYSSIQYPVSAGLKTSLKTCGNALICVIIILLLSQLARYPS